MFLKRNRRLLWAASLIIVLGVVALQSGRAGYFRGITSKFFGQSAKQAARSADKDGKQVASEKPPTGDNAAAGSAHDNSVSAETKPDQNAASGSAKEAADSNHEKTLARADGAGIPIQRATEGGFTPAFQGAGATSSGQEGQLVATDARTAGRQDVIRVNPRPTEGRLTRARSFNGDLRDLPFIRPVKHERIEHDEPQITPRIAPGTPAGTQSETSAQTPPSGENLITPSAAAPAPTKSFDGLDFATWGAGHPPDTNGDVGPTYFIQTINTSIGIFRKSDNVRVAAFTFNTFMSQGSFGNLCDTDNFGDPVVVYDSFEDRWVITDFAFKLDVSNNVVAPAFQCFAVSKTGDPVVGGWNYYSTTFSDALGDYPKMGVWPDGLYLSANMFTFGAGSAYVSPRAIAYNKAEMYAGAPTAKMVTFNGPPADFTVIPSNARLQTGTPPPGTPNFYVASEEFLNALTVYKFHVDFVNVGLSTFTGPDTPLASTSWPNATPPNALSSGGNALDVLAIRAMVQNQYTNIGGVESLWDSHTVRRGNTTGLAAPRWYQVNVTGGTVAAAIPQATTWDPDGANVISRFMPSVAVDRAGNLAMAYSTSSSTTFPAIKYAGRLAADPLNTFSQTEQLLVQGTGTQTGSCGGTCIRWGDYSAMTLDPDGCTFWFTNMYYNVNGLNFLTRVGTFSYPSCTPVGAGGSIQGTVTLAGNPVNGATVALGSRTTTTDSSGNYSFIGIPAGTYPVITASKAGFNSSSATAIAVTDGNITTQNLSLTGAALSNCLTDTTSTDFQNGAFTNVEVTTSPGDMKLTSTGVEAADQVSNPAALSTTNNLSATVWTGQTFRAGITGNLTRMTLGLGLASGTSGTITVEIRNLNGTNPGTTVLATSTAGPVTNVGSAATYTVNFATPAAVVAGTSYSIVLRTSVGNTVFGVRGSTAGGSTLANGQVFTTTNSGTTWTPVAADLFFTSFVTPPFAFSTSGNFVSGVKDGNPDGSSASDWTTISWNATVPANTTLQFQVAGSNSQYGPFNFVGPDGTASTFYTTSGGSIAQFNGLRYLKYKAFFTTTDTNVSPTLNDVTVCFSNVTVISYANPTDSTCAGSTPCFNTIAGAIAAVQTGGTINVQTGTYNENVNVSGKNLNFSGNVTINGLAFSSGTVNCGSSTLHISGDFTNSGGTFNAGTCTIDMNGLGPLAPGGGPVLSKFKPSAGPQTISGTNTFFNLIVNDPAGVVFSGGNNTVTGTLTLTQGILDTGSNTAIISNTGGIVRTSDFILGIVKKQAISGSFSFPMGDASGFTPLDIANAAGGGDLTVQTTTGTAGSLNPATTLGEFWTLTASGSVSLDMTFNYLPADVNGDETKYRIIRVESGIPVTFGLGQPNVSYDTVGHKATITGVSQFSDWTLGESVSPTAVNFDGFIATASVEGTVLQWKTGFEVNNLGFNVYRQVNGQRVRINPSLIAGTALMVGSNIRLESGYTYNWLDDVTDRTTGYWLEAVDINGTSTWHGPFGISSSPRTKITRTKSVLLNNLTNSGTRQANSVIQHEYPAGSAVQTGSQSAGAFAVPQGVTSGRTATRPSALPASLQKQWQLAAQPAIKIAINKTGWYRVSASDLMAAGLNGISSPTRLQMFVGGVEIPIKVNSADGAHLDSIEFYGTGLDTTTTDMQVYWLTSGLGAGKRIALQQSPGSNGETGSPSFQYTVERKDRSLYFSSLKNGDAENWFGPVVATSPVSQTINIHNHDGNAGGQAELEVALQGVTTNSHQVTVSLNGQALNTMTFDSMEHPVLKLSIPESSLIEGDNQITFAAAASGDVSLIDYVRVTYAHTYAADNNGLFASATGNQPIKVTGFTSNQIRAIDVATNQPVELVGTIVGDAGNYSISVDGAKRRNLLVFTPDKVLQPVSITANQPSTINNASNGADFVIIANKAFAASVQPLADLRQSQGYRVSVVDVDNIYDEFSYGVHSPQAVKDFLNWTYLHWQIQPHFVMFAGSGTLDPRNYTGEGFMDFVPTKLIDIDSMETSSDGWFVDFKNDGREQMSVGRLPVHTAAEATIVVNKIIGYEQSQGAEGMVLVSDMSEGTNFTSVNSQIRAIVPSSLSVVNINRTEAVTDSKAALMEQLNNGGKIFNYAGHGSVNLWRAGLLTVSDMDSLADHKTSPLIVIMSCLNGYFQDPKLASLGEALLKVNNGGAVSVWASSGMTDAGNQTLMNQEFFKQIFANPTITLGDAIRAAKSATDDQDIRKTWILFGDPTMRIKR